MSFKATFAQDISEYSQKIAENSQDPPDDSGSATGLGRFAAYGSGPTPSANLIYHTGRDRFFCPFRASSAAQGSSGVGYFDPNFVADSPPNADYVNQTTLGLGAITTLQNDQFDPATSAQRIFLANAGSGNIDELDPNTLGLTTDVFDEGPNGIFQNTISGPPTGDGNWQSLVSTNLFFTGLKNGIRVTSGEVNNANGNKNNVETLTSGVNVHPDGLYLANLNTGTLEGNNVTRSFGWVDIRTRRLVGLIGAEEDGLSTGIPSFFPLEVAANPTGNSSESEINGRTFQWICAQYLPDPDATFAIPKGELIFIPRLEIPSINVPVLGDVQEVYIRITDFNPFNVAAAEGSRDRQHGRKRLTSAIIFNVFVPFDLTGQNPMNNPANPSVQFDPLRGRWVMVVADGTSLEPFPIDTNYQTVGFFSRSVDPVIVTSPAARDVPRTNDVVEFESFVGGDLGEPVGGSQIDWTLNRRSTEGELLDASTFPGTSTVANPPIDDVSPSIPEGTLVVIADGTTLVEGADYSVVLSTGIITWITDQSGAAVVTATYEHRSTGASPAHGTLLTSASTSDEGGQVRTQVLFPDNDALVGTIDFLESEFA
jgi:hypothetical protein